MRSSIRERISPRRSSSPIGEWKTVREKKSPYHVCAHNPLHKPSPTLKSDRYPVKLKKNCDHKSSPSKESANIAKKIVPRRGAKPYDVVKNVVPSKKSIVGSYKWWGNRRDFIRRETLDQEFILFSTIVDNFNLHVAPQKYDRGSHLPPSIRYINRGYILNASLLHILDCTEKDRYFRDRNMITIPLDQRKSAGLSRYPRTPYIYGKRAQFSQIFRAGVIPVLRDGNGNFLYGFAVDSNKWSPPEEQKLDISDFGGGLDIGESAAQGAIREWYEESEHLFSSYTIQPTDLVTYYAGFATYFVMINVPFGTREYGETLQYGELLEKSYLNAITDELPLEDVPEVRGLRWLSAKEVIEIVDHPPPEMGGMYDQCLPFAVNMSDIDMILHLSY